MIAEAELPDQVDRTDIDLTDSILGYDILIDGHCVGAIEGVPGDIQYLMVEPPHQGKGVARATLNAFIHRSQLEGASEVTTNNVIHSAMEHILETEGFEERTDEIGWVKEI
ncbi:GNAT family N-acetyltransferase [Halorubrum ezzemoulense]|uniref:GNAT family N-acetyltransferase n=1 Tax=Halorubrum TaxID=56688 RepID=UPI00126703CB|nr:MULTISPECIES: GNAT family N-acetyltransferase [Halorubrum]MDB9250851.1 GNAT family N-acetyltransferase [Halorubrum ezzemoulense]MDB9261022.1 GNAT family N-acetyltransferase [Halorubrum ezzemoulense]MDB9264414.1 GNAT family N-acetyltransferase [Halorubrum ezzemoulense]MDB9267899.1 GNAT family N-acetyltransferase [Halorubrum ezzemoulense]MDB9271383.1 GNAT family N-acetyltransferase [Halorubrum ezzemoulense]